MADILLINPYYSQRKEYYSFYKPAPPLGLMYLASYLRKFSLETKIAEFGVFDIKNAVLQKDRIRFGLSDKKIIKVLQKEKPKIVGITSMYSVYFGDVLEIARTVKRFSKKIKIVIGGNHASSYYDFILKDRNIDFVVIGEGEQTFLELCQAIFKNKRGFQRIKGLAFNKKDKIVKTKPRELIVNLDDIPFPARDLVDYEKYLENTRNHPYSMRRPAGEIVSSRGCPGSCVYCTVKAVWGRTWRARSPENVVDEIEELAREHGVKEINFLDDSASIDRKRWNAICDEIICRKLDIKWTTPNGIAHWTLNKRLLKKMKKAGCYRVTFGIESGNVETRKFLGKPYSLKQARELIQYANKIGMWTICTNIIGFPYEKMNSIKDTIEFAKKSETDFATFYLLVPQPTSDVYQYFEKEKLLNLDRFFKKLELHGDEFEKVNYILNETGCDTKYFKKEELRGIQKKAYREFIIYRALSYLLNPKKFFWKIRSVEDFFYVLKLGMQGLIISFRTFNPLSFRTSAFLYKKIDYKQKK